MAKEFHAWVADMSNSIIDASEVKDGKKVSENPALIQNSLAFYQKQWYNATISEWYRYYSDAPKTDHEKTQFLNMYLKQIFNIHYMPHGSTSLPAKVIQILEDTFGNI